MAERLDDPDLDVREDDILVLQNAGPKGAPGMPEAGYIPIPRKLAAAGVKDMVRISDARMSGTAFGSIVLHVSPEAAIGGPLALSAFRRRDQPRRRKRTPRRSPSTTQNSNGEAEVVAAPVAPAPTVAIESSTSTRCCRPNSAAISTS